MENSKAMCPVCTLFLREGITLQAHLNTHPKEQVIEALLKVSNGGTFAPQTTGSATTPSSYVPVQTLANSNSSFLPSSTTYVNPPTQMTTAVTYQHFMTSNGSTIMPQFIQVPTIVNSNNNNIPPMSNQTMNFVPNQTVNYSHTVYNPLYNPYIPQPYPFNQPLYTSFPVSALPSNNSSFQQNELERNTESSVESSVQSHQEKTTVKSNVMVNRCTTTTSTETQKRACKSAIKKSVLKCTGIRRKKRIFKVKPSDSHNTHSVIKSVRNSSSTVSRVSTLTKRSVIKSMKPKNAPNTVSNLITNLRVTTPPPLTVVSQATSDSVSSTKTISLPEIRKDSATISQTEDFIKSEDVVDSIARPHSTPAMTFGSLLPELTKRKYFRHPQKINSVIVESSNIVKLSNNQVEDCQENFETDKTEIPCVETLNIIESLAENAKDPLCTDTNEEVSFTSSHGKTQECDDDEEEPEEEEEEEEEVELEEENFHKQEEKDDFEEVVIEEMKESIFQEALNQDIPNEINSENIERNCDDSEIFIQQENIFFNEDKGKNKVEESTPNSSVVHISTSGPEKSQEHLNQNPNEYSYYCKDFGELNYSICRAENEPANENTPPKHSEAQTVTYTDLQPAKSPRLFQDLGLTSSVNFNSFMQVEGIKIFINNTPATNDPLKLQSVQNNDGESNGFLKTENQINNRAIVDSVIQLVSANNESKTEFTFGDNYLATTSQISENQMDLPDLSPMALNIQADESMPARGELSEQESLGAENSTWNLFHGDSGTNLKSLDEWKNDNNQSVTILSSNKTSSRSFKCSTCGKEFSCPKERRVHKNTVHPTKDDKLVPVVKKTKNYRCNFCPNVYTSMRERKIHVLQIHYPESKRKTQIKEENGVLESIIEIEKTEVDVKNETVQNDVKVENSVPAVEAESERVKFCSHCSLPFVGVKKLREHLRLVHGEIRFKCEKCEQCFDEETEYNGHLLIHPLVCDKCGKTFHRKQNLNLHLKRHLEVKPFECTICPKSFITRQKLEEHMNGHSGRKPLKCTLCDKTFSRHSNLIQHRNLHHLEVKKKVKDFVCRCGEVFHSLRKLEWHKEVHEQKPKPCPFCSQKFIHNASVTRHIRRAHMPDYLPGTNREVDNVQCPICEKVYLRSSLVVHMRVHNGEKPFTCKICNKSFTTKWNLELHNWTHQSRSNMPFKCHICKSAFFRESDFVAHLNAHRNYKPFTCNVCGQKFIRKYSCLRHQEEHRKSKQFVCGVNGCAKSFHRGYYLRDHMKVHTGVRPHTCPVCGKTSSTKSNHNKHVRIHDTREPVNTEN